jgi:hypothetical protein
MNKEHQKLLEAVKTIQEYCNNQGRCRGCPLDNKGNSCLLDRSIWNIWEIERRLTEAENEN